MAAGMRIEDVAELQFAFPTFTEGVRQAAQMVVQPARCPPDAPALEQSARHALSSGITSAQ